MHMREKIQHSNFSKSIAIFLVVPIILITSFSFPRPAQAEFLVPILVTAIFSSITLGLGTLFLIDGTTCLINIVWGCSNTTSGVTTVIDITPSAVSLSANPLIIDQGESSKLTWSSTNATSCSASGAGSWIPANSPTSGNVLVTPPTTSSYQVSCTGPGGTTNSNIETITVRVPKVSINAIPSRVVKDSSGNGATTISWDAKNVKDCTITKNGILAFGSPLIANASRTVASSTPDIITGQTTYVISCTNNAGAGAASDTQIVNLVSSFQEF